MTEIEVRAQPLVIVRTLSGHHVPLRQPRFVAPSKLGDGKHDGYSGVAKLAMNVMLLMKASKIRWLFLMIANFGKYSPANSDPDIENSYLAFSD